MSVRVFKISVLGGYEKKCALTSHSLKTKRGGIEMQLVSVPGNFKKTGVKKNEKMRKVALIHRLNFV